MKGGELSANQRQRLLGFFERRPRLGPETVHIDITNACNLDCVTCWNYAPGLSTPKPADWKQQRMDAASFHRVLDEVAATGAERIILSGGGEPFMHPQIYDFIAAVKARRLILTVISNGTLCDFSRLAELQVDQMLINTSSASAAGYIAYHPNQTVETFEHLIDGVNSVRGRIGVNLVQVINALNAHELVAMVELSAQVGARASFKLGDTPPGTEACALSDAQKRTLLDRQIPQAREMADRLEVRHNLDAFAGQIGLSITAKVISAGAPALRADRCAISSSSPLRPDALPTTCKKNDVAPPPCFAGYLYSRVFVDGRVFFCCEHISVGHINEANFGEIWTSAPYDAVRQRLHEGRGYPGCARCGKHDMNFIAARQCARLQAEGAQQ